VRAPCRFTTVPSAALALSGVLFLGSLAACRSTESTGNLELRVASADSTLALRVGEEVRAPDSVMRISFLGVSGDSRCPTDVQCVWAGDAAVEIGVAFGTGPTVPYMLHTTLFPRWVDQGGYRITLRGLRPAPVSTSQIPQSQYVAELTLERIATAAR